MDVAKTPPRRDFVKRLRWNARQAVEAILDAFDPCFGERGYSEGVCPKNFAGFRIRPTK